MNVRLEKGRAPWRPLDDRARRRRLEREGYALTRYVCPPGTCFPEHFHAVDTKDAVLRGRLKISAEGKEIVMERGGTLEIPAGTPRTAVLLGDEADVRLDATRD
jgi:quercetin dioxygenase-like cupin family protein